MGVREGAPGGATNYVSLNYCLYIILKDLHDGMVDVFCMYCTTGKGGRENLDDWYKYTRAALCHLASGDGLMLLTGNLYFWQMRTIHVSKVVILRRNAEE